VCLECIEQHNASKCRSLATRGDNQLCATAQPLRSPNTGYCVNVRGKVQPLATGAAYLPSRVQEWCERFEGLGAGSAMRSAVARFGRLAEAHGPVASKDLKRKAAHRRHFDLRGGPGMADCML